MVGPRIRCSEKIVNALRAASVRASKVPRATRRTYLAPSASVTRTSVAFVVETSGLWMNSSLMSKPPSTMTTYTDTTPRFQAANVEMQSSTSCPSLTRFVCAFENPRLPRKVNDPMRLVANASCP